MNAITITSTNRLAARRILTGSGMSAAVVRSLSLADLRWQIADRIAEGLLEEGPVLVALAAAPPRVRLDEAAVRAIVRDELAAWGGQ